MIRSKTEENKAIAYSHGRGHEGPRQVRTLAGVRRGNILIAVTPSNGTAAKQRILVLSEPKKVEKLGEEYTLFDYLTLTGVFKGAIRYASVADKSVIPYEGNNGPVWNNVNHLLRTGKKRLSEEEIKQVLEDIYKVDYRYI